MMREKRKGPTSKVVYNCRGCEYLHGWAGRHYCHKNGWEDENMLKIKSSLNAPIECFYMLLEIRKLKLQKIIHNKKIEN